MCFEFSDLQQKKRALFALLKHLFECFFNQAKFHCVSDLFSHTHVLYIKSIKTFLGNILYHICSGSRVINTIVLN